MQNYLSPRFYSSLSGFEKKSSRQKFSDGIPRQLTIVLLLFVSCSVCGSSKGDWFDNFNGGLQQDWNFGSFTANQTPSNTFQAGSFNNALVLTDPTSVFSGGAALGIGWVDQEFTDVTVVGTFNPAGESNLNGYVGLLARADLSTLSGYALTYNPITGEADLVRASGGDQTLLAETNIGPQTNSLFAQLTVLGSQITGRLFDAPGGTLLADLSVVDSNFSSGVSGVVVQIDDDGLFNPLRGTWDNVASVAVIPEPASTFLLGLTSLTVMLGRRSRCVIADPIATDR